MAVMELNICKRCKSYYHWNKSSSTLRMTYCSILCEIGGLGFSIESIEHISVEDKERAEKDEPSQPIEKNQNNS